MAAAAPGPTSRRVDVRPHHDSAHEQAAAGRAPASTPQPLNRNLMPQPMPVPVDDDDAGDQGPVPPPGMVPTGARMPGVPGVSAVPDGRSAGPAAATGADRHRVRAQLPQPQPTMPNPVPASRNAAAGGPADADTRARRAGRPSDSHAAAAGSRQARLTITAMNGAHPWSGAASTPRAGTITARSIPTGTTTRPTSRSSTPCARWLVRLPPGRASSTPAAARACSSRSTPRRLAIEGLDPNYSSARVRTGSLTALPYADGLVRSRAVSRRPRASARSRIRRGPSAELHRVLKPGGELLVSVPNLAHLQSRDSLSADRPADPHGLRATKHPGDRPAGEYLHARGAAGFALVASPRHLSDGAGADAVHPAASARAAAAAPAADAPAARPRLVLPEPADVPEAL